MAWLTRDEAAKRVARSRRTIDRWIDRGTVKETLGRISEAKLLEADRTMRERRAHAGDRRVQRASPELTQVLHRARIELADRIREIDPYGLMTWRVDVVDGPGENEVRLRATPAPRP